MPELFVLGDAQDPTAGVIQVGYGGNLFVYTDGSYGHQTDWAGDIISHPAIKDSLLRVDTDDYAVAGKPAQVVARRLFITVVRDAGLVQWRITPRIDFQTLLAPQLFTVQATNARKVTVLKVKLARVCTYIGAKIEVYNRKGPARIVGIAVAYVPLAIATPLAAAQAQT